MINYVVEFAAVWDVRKGMPAATNIAYNSPVHRRIHSEDLCLKLWELDSERVKHSRRVFPCCLEIACISLWRTEKRPEADGIPFSTPLVAAPVIRVLVTGGF